MREFTLAGFAAHLVGLIAEVEIEKHRALEMAARIVEAEAKAEIGHKQGDAGPFRAWEPLAESTINGFMGHPGKDELGFSPPDYDPLLREGEMRDSVEHVIAKDVAHVGSNSMVAVYQELGTQHIPARSFLGGAAVRKKNEIGHMVGHDLVMVLSGRTGHRTDIP